MALFFRDGSECIGQPVTDEKGKSFGKVWKNCGRCGGQGGSEAWRATGWTCYDCNGARGHNVSAPLYTTEKLAKLNETQDKKRAKIQAKIDADRIANERAIAERRPEFNRKNGHLVAFLREYVAEHADGRENADDFARSLLHAADAFASWTDAQAGAVASWQRRIQAAVVQRAGSQYVRAPGVRFDTEVTVERVYSFERPRFNANWLREVAYIVTLRDNDGNALVVKGTSFCPKKGTKLTIRATVKEHKEFYDEKQTILTRVQVKATVQAAEAA